MWLTSGLASGLATNARGDQSVNPHNSTVRLAVAQFDLSVSVFIRATFQDASRVGVLSGRSAPDAPSVAHFVQMLESRYADCFPSFHGRSPLRFCNYKYPSRELRGQSENKRRTSVAVISAATVNAIGSVLSDATRGMCPEVVPAA